MFNETHTFFVLVYILCDPSLQESGLVYALKKCLTNPSRNEEISIPFGCKSGGKDKRDPQCALTQYQLLAKLCVAAKCSVGDVKEKLCFHPFEEFRSLQKHRPDALIPSLFASWPASEQNSFVLPVCIYSCIQSGDSSLQYHTAEFIRIAQDRCARQCPGVPLLLAALIYSGARGRVNVAGSLIAAGVDSNAIACTARLKEFAPTWRPSSGSDIFARIDEITPLALAVTLKDLHLVRKLIQLGANPCLVCFRFCAV